MNLLRDIRYQFARNNHAINRIIAINIAVFLFFGLIHLLLFLFGSGSPELGVFTLKLMLPASFSNFSTQPWSIITYLFLHDNFLHILFNMLWLYWIGTLLHEYLGNRKVYEAYFAGGVFGGIVFMLCYELFPVFEHSLQTTYALGASAGVLAVVAAAATLLPDYSIQLLLIGPVKLKWLALVSIGLDLISIPNGNAGGHIAHLGGALFGFLYIKYLYHRGGHLIPDKVVNLFRFKSGSALKIHHKSPHTKSGNPSVPSQAEIDEILDKISRSGYDSLSKREKEILFKASKD